MLVGMPMGSARPAGQRLDAAVEARFPVVDVRSALVVSATDAAYAPARTATAAWPAVAVPA